MDDNDGIFARFDNLVEIADSAIADSRGQWAVMPDSLFTLQQKPPDKIRGRQIFMASDGNQRALEPPRHVFDKTRLTTAGRALKDYRQARRVGRLKEIYFPPNR